MNESTESQRQSALKNCRPRTCLLKPTTEVWKYEKTGVGVAGAWSWCGGRRFQAWFDTVLTDKIEMATCPDCRRLAAGLRPEGIWRRAIMGGALTADKAQRIIKAIEEFHKARVD